MTETPDEYYKRTGFAWGAGHEFASPTPPDRNNINAQYGKMAQKMKQLPTVDFDDIFDRSYYTSGVTNGEAVRYVFDMLQKHCHAASYNRGWWLDPVTGHSLIPNDEIDMRQEISALREAFFPYVVATKIVLIHSEVTEMLESHRTGAYDDKIPFPGIVAEGADVFVRIFDLMGMFDHNNASAHGYEAKEHNWSVGLALLAKLPYNAGRIDHGLEARRKPNGKKY